MFKNLRFHVRANSVVGCTAKSRENYVRYAHRLLKQVFADNPHVDWSQLMAPAITDFVRREAGRVKMGGLAVTATRSFLRFLATQGVVSDGLLGAVPPILTWRHAALPRAISADEVAKVIAVCDSESDYGLRERAIVLLLARLGLRAGELIRLRIDDIDWRRGCVLVAVNRIVAWLEQGIDVRRQLPTLSVYLGHVNVAASYWYLTATPEILVHAGTSFAAAAGRGGEQ